jgi:hypothetical protein
MIYGVHFLTRRRFVHNKEERVSGISSTGLRICVFVVCVHLLKAKIKRNEILAAASAALLGALEN